MDLEKSPYNWKYKDCDIFKIEKDKNGIKQIILCGYGYYVDNPKEERPYRFLSYRGFERPLSEVLRMGFTEFADDDVFRDEHAVVYIEDFTEDELVYEFENFGYHFNMPPMPKLCKNLDENIEEGLYYF